MSHKLYKTNLFIGILLCGLNSTAQNAQQRYFGSHWGYFYQPTDSTPLILNNFFNADTILFEKIPHTTRRVHSYVKLSAADSTFNIYLYLEVPVPDTGQELVDTIGFYGTSNVSEGDWLFENEKFGFKQADQDVYTWFRMEDINDPGYTPKTYLTSTGDYRTHFRLIRIR